MKERYCQNNGEREDLYVQVSLSQDNTKSKGPNHGVLLIMHSLPGSSDETYGKERGWDDKHDQVVNKYEQDNL